MALPRLPDPKRPDPKHPSLPTGFTRQVGAHLKPLCSREGRWGRQEGDGAIRRRLEACSLCGQAKQRLRGDTIAAYK